LLFVIAFHVPFAAHVLRSEGAASGRVVSLEAFSSGFPLKTVRKQMLYLSIWREDYSGKEMGLYGFWND
jgi:hypothetical protein